jgi:two-component system, OmpR family, sensor kinase
LPLDVRPVDLRSLITAVVQTMDRVSERHPIALVMPNRPVIVPGDAERLQRVFENLVGNAIKYSPDGGAVEIALVVSGREAVVTVRDHGIGISPEALTGIFQRGYRSAAARAIAPGLGLGLNISREIVGSHGGSLDAISGQPSGSTFRVRLPLVGAAPGSPQRHTTTSTNRDSDSAA